MRLSIERTKKPEDELHSWIPKNFYNVIHEYQIPEARLGLYSHF